MHTAIVCGKCGGSPRAVFIDGRCFKDRRGSVGKIYMDDLDRPLTFPAAYRLLEAIRADFDRNPKGFDPTRWSREKRKGFRLSDAGAKWIEFLRETRSKTYFVHQEIFLRHIRARIGDMDVREIRAGHVEDLYRNLFKVFAPKSVQSILYALRTLLNWLHRREEIERVPAFPEVHVPQRIVRWLSREEQSRVIDVAPERVRLLFEVLVESGIRPGEGVALTCGDLQEGGVLVNKAFSEDGKIKETKAGQIQFKRISDYLYVRLAESAQGKLPTAFLFTRESGKPWAVRDLSSIWRGAAKAAGVNAPLYEGTRHSFATRLRIEKERAMGQELAVALGHRRAGTTLKHYARDGRGSSRN